MEGGGIMNIEGNPNHNHYTWKMKRLEEFFNMHSDSDEKLVKKAAREYVNLGTRLSYSKIALKYPELAMQAFGWMVRKIKHDREMIVPCIFCELGNNGDTYCKFCLGDGYIDKEEFKQYLKRLPAVVTVKN